MPAPKLLMVLAPTWGTLSAEAGRAVKGSSAHPLRNLQESWGLPPTLPAVAA
jgi:hypothetical protein